MNGTDNQSQALLGQFDKLSVELEFLDKQELDLRNEIAELEAREPSSEFVLACLTKREILVRIPRKRDNLILERNTVNEKIHVFLVEVEIPRVQKFLTNKRDQAIDLAGNLLKDFCEPNQVNEVKRLCQQLPAIQRWQSRINRCLSPSSSYHNQLRNLIAVEKEAATA
jgi:hypothetical protein